MFIHTFLWGKPIDPCEKNVKNVWMATPKNFPDQLLKECLKELPSSFKNTTVRPRKKETHVFIKQVKFSENCNHSSEKVYTVTKFSLSSFF